MHLKSRFLLGLAIASVTACASSTQSTSSPAESPSSEPGDAASLKVANRSSTDMDVYVVRSRQRIRIGLAPQGETTSFTLATALMTGGGAVHFEAVPARSSAGVRSVVRSEPGSVTRGEIITFDIPPQ